MTAAFPHRRFARRICAMTSHPMPGCKTSSAFSCPAQPYRLTFWAPLSSCASSSESGPALPLRCGPRRLSRRPPCLSLWMLCECSRTFRSARGRVFASTRGGRLRPSQLLDHLASVDLLSDVIDFILSRACFSFDDTVYEMVGGAATGQTHPVVLAIFMSFLCTDLLAVRPRGLGSLDLLRRRLGDCLGFWRARRASSAMSSLTSTSGVLPPAIQSSSR